MIILRKEQLEAFDKAALDDFIKRAYHHIKDNIHNKYESLGSRKVKESVLTAIANAKEYDINKEYDVLRFINFMYVFGFDFDENIPWAAAVLNNKRLDGTAKMDELSYQATLHERYIS